MLKRMLFLSGLLMAIVSANSAHAVGSANPVCVPDAHTLAYYCPAEGSNTVGGVKKLLKEINILFGETVTLPQLSELGTACITPDNKIFAGWQYNGTTYVAGSDFTLTTDNVPTVDPVDMTAFFADNDSAVISYNRNGGIINDTSYSVTCTTTSANIVLPTNVTRTGYTFDGWYDKNGYKVEELDISQCVKDATIELTANWTANKIEVTFDANGATSGQAQPQGRECSYDGTCSTATQGTLLKSNHVFLGWAKTNNATVAEYAENDDIKNITTGAPITLYAVWSKCADAVVGNNVATAELVGVVGNVCQYKHVCEVGYYNANHNMQISSATMSCAACTNLPVNAVWTAAATTNSCAWDCKACVTGDNAVSCDVTKNETARTCTYTATCNENTFKPTASGVTTGCVPCPANSTAATGNNATSCTCLPNYSVGGSVTGATSTASAQCSPIKYDIKYELDSGTNYSGAPSSYTYGTGVTINGVPTRAGYVFMGWCDAGNANCKYSRTISTTATGTQTLYAKWTKAVCNATNATATPSVTNNTVKCAVVCNAGYSKTGAGDTTTSFDVTGNKNTATVDVACQIATHTITIKKNGGSGTLTVDDKTAPGVSDLVLACVHGTTVNMPAWNGTTNALVKANDVFTGWDNVSVTCDADKTVTAKWATCNYTAGSHSTNSFRSVDNNSCVYDIKCDDGYWTSGDEHIGLPGVATGGTEGCEARQSMVVFDLNGATAGQLPENLAATYDAPMPSINTAAPTRTGYTFMGWYDNADYTKGTQYYTVDGVSARTFDRVIEPDNPFNLYAGWKINSYECAAGTYLKAGATACAQCLENSYCTGDTYTFDTTKDQGIESCPSEYPKSAGGAVDASMCYRACTVDDVVGAVFVTGTVAKGGTNTCKATICVSGRYLENGICETLDGYTCPGGTSGKNGCYKSCTVSCVPQTCPNNATTCTDGTETATGTEYYGGTCDATAPICSLVVDKCKSGLLLKNNACTTCPANATCDGSSDWVCNTNYNKTSTGCALGVFTCTVGKAADGSICSPGSYCPGGNVDAGMEKDTSVGCERTCPDGFATSDAGATTKNACYKKVAVSTGAVPTHCASATWNECEYQDYYGIEDTPCTPTVKSVTANKNAYVNGTACEMCAAPYIMSDGGAIDNTYCYTTCADKTGYTLVGGVDYLSATDTCKYNANKYTVSYSCGEGTGVAPSATEATYDVNFTPAANTCTRDGYTFGGWKVSDTDDVKTTAFKWTYTENKTFTAKWVVKGMNTISFNVDGGSSVNNTECNAESSDITLPTTTRTGYTFDGWYNDATDEKTTVIKSGTCTSGMSFTAKWTANTYNCSAGTYLKAGATTCTQCPANSFCVGGTYTFDTTKDQGIEGCPTAYPNSDAGAKSSDECYIVRTNTGTEVAPALPLGCATQTVNVCTKPTCDYKDYQGQTGETCNPGTCQQTHKACTSVKADYYLSNGVAKTCDSYDAHYPVSDGGNITSDKCYGTFTKVGKQVNGNVPTNCASVTEWNACNPGTCEYTMYADKTVKSDCTPTDCTKTAKSVTAEINYYVNGATCSACPSGYPTSAGGAIDSTYCYTTCASKTGYALTSGVNYNGAADTCEYTANKYTATYACGEGTGTAPSATEATYDVNFTPAANTCTRDGYTFGGWMVSDTSDVKTAGVAFMWTYTENKTLTAKWIAGDMNVVTFNTNGGSAVNNTECNVESSDITLPTTTRTGYTFDGWYNDTTKVKTTVIKSGTCTSAMSFTAQWTKNEYTITYDCGMGTLVSGTDNIQNVVYDDTFKTHPASICERKGYVFVRWNGEYNQANTTYTYTTAKNITLTAQWTADGYTCAAGTYLKAGATACTQCPANSYCTGGTYTFDTTKDQGIEGCPTAYPNSVSGSRAKTECYSNTKQRAWTGAQIDGNVPTNCASVTEWNACSIAACDYVVYSNAAGTGDGTIKSGCATNNANCTKTAKSVTANKNAYVNGATCSACPSGYPTSDGGNITSDKCYGTFTKVGKQVNGNVPTNCASVTEWNACNPGTCEYTMYADKTVKTDCTPTDCTKTAKSVTAEINYYVNGATCSACPTNHPLSEGGMSGIARCYTTCESYDIVGGTAYPVADKAYYDNTCEYYAISDNGNTCKIENINGMQTCVEVSCKSDYEFINGACQPCDRDNATAYKPNGNCQVAQCKMGYHPEGDQCVIDAQECSLPNASGATKVWDADLGRFGECVATSCNDGYHLDSGACVTSVETCDVKHGTGTREWDEKRGTWGECIATSCDAGYTNDAYDSAEPNAQCGRCRNATSVLGEPAASSYVSGCEIASCMYQGELYKLENNECVPICPIEPYEDETGVMYWNKDTKKCERKCFDGYMSW